MPSAMPRTVKNKRTANAVTTPAIIGPQRIRSRIGTSATSTSTAGTPITPVAAVEGGNPVESILPVADDSAARFPRGSVLIHLPSYVPAPLAQANRPTTAEGSSSPFTRPLPHEPRVKPQTSYAATLVLSGTESAGHDGANSFRRVERHDQLSRTTIRLSPNPRDAEGARRHRDYAYAVPYDPREIDCRFAGERIGTSVLFRPETCARLTRMPTTGQFIAVSGRYGVKEPPPWARHIPLVASRFT